MRIKNFCIVVFFFVLSRSVFSQQTNELWFGAEAKRNLTENVEASFGLNTRLYGYSFQLFYPELSFKYKLTKWVKLSLDYRLLNQRNKYGNYHFSNRLNGNVEFQFSLNKQVDIGCRIRYQNTISGLSNLNMYSPDFDETIRIKPSIDYKVSKKSKMSYHASIDFFYDPINHKGGRQFTKYRTSLGVEINLKGPNTLSIDYLYGRNINDVGHKWQHVLSLTYGFEWKKKQEKEKN